MLNFVSSSSFRRNEYRELGDGFSIHFLLHSVLQKTLEVTRFTFFASLRFTKNTRSDAVWVILKVK